MSRPRTRRDDMDRLAKPPQRPDRPIEAAGTGQLDNRHPVPTAGLDCDRRPLVWLPWTTFVLSVIGLADSGSQVYTHFTSTGLLGCSGNGDPCLLVQTSSYAWISGIPVAVLGAAFYVAMVVICSPQGLAVASAGRSPCQARRSRGRNDLCALPRLPRARQHRRDLSVLHERARHHFPVARLIVFAATGVRRTPRRR
jgi:Vitamin K epoxide reductase family